MPRSNDTGEEPGSSRAALRWIETTGGPHILTAEEGLPDWKGCDGWEDNSESDPSDYAQACRNSANWLGLIQSAKYDVAVFGGDVGPVAWFPASDRSGTFVQWIGCDNDAAVLAMLALDESGEVLRLKEETLVLETGPSGHMVLLDASAHGLEVRKDEREHILLQPGRYGLNAYYLETSACMIVVRKLSHLDP